MRNLHEWNLSYAEAHELQRRLAGEVEFTPFTKPPKVIVGLDCAFSGDGKRIFAAAGLHIFNTTAAAKMRLPSPLNAQSSPTIILGHFVNGVNSTSPASRLWSS